MRVLGSVLLVLALIKGSLVAMYTMGTIDVELDRYQQIETAFDLLITIILGAWCFRDGALAWKYVMWYFSAMIVYTVIYTLVMEQIWNDVVVLELALLALLYGSIIYAFSRKEFLSTIGIDKVPSTLKLVRFVSVLCGTLLMMNHFFNWIVAIFAVTLIVLVARNGRAVN